MPRRRRICLLGLLFSPLTNVQSAEESGFQGIPGTTQTFSGYDTEFGSDAICWESQSTGDNDVLPNENDTVVPFPNPLIADYGLVGRVQLLLECPSGVSLTVRAPRVLWPASSRPRTDTVYDFELSGTLNLDTMRGRRILSDDGDGRIALQVLVCDVANAGFCTPFVHEQSNAREGIDTPTPPGSLHGQTHIHSPYVFLDLPRNQSILEFNATVPLQASSPGQYFTIGALQVFTTTSLQGTPNTAPLVRYDIANAADKRILTFQEPAKILRVSTEVEMFIAIVSSLSALLVLFLLYQTYIHRNNQIMKLSQGKFLIVLLVAALIASVSVMFINPKNDIYCQVFPPLAYLPATLIYAVILARVWRAQALLSPLLQEFYENRLTTNFSRFVNCITCSSSNGDSLRTTVSDQQVMMVIFIFTLPQLVLQICAQVFQPRGVQTRYNEDESVGAVYCSADGVGIRNATNWCLFLVLGLNVLLLVVAQASRKLPSLFNEVDSIVAMLAINVIVVVIGYAIVRVSDKPSTSPSVRFIILTTVILSITLNSSLRLLWPKLQMIWRGETVMVSKLVSDQRKTLRREQGDGNDSDEENAIDPSWGYGLSSRKKSSRYWSSRVGSSGRRRMQEPAVTTLAEVDSSPQFLAEPKPARPGMPDTPLSFRSSHVEEAVHAASSNHFSKTEPPSQPPQPSSTASRPTTMVISDQTAPSRSLVVPLLELQEVLADVNRGIKSGRSVSHEDWEDLRELVTRLGGKFTDAVAFAWEQDVSTSNEEYGNAL